MSYVTLKNQKRISVMMIIVCILLFALCIRLVFVQILDLNNFKEKAYEQQTRERSISAKRGNIYDATGEKILAQSVSVNIITAVPNSIEKEDKEKVAENLARILEKDKDDVLAKLRKNSSTEIIASKVGQEKAKKVLEYIEEENVEGIRVDEDTLRVYPYKELLSQVLGFVGTDNQGLYGIEKYYDDDLAGIPGKIVGSTDGKGRETPFTNEQYIAPVQRKRYSTYC